MTEFQPITKTFELSFINGKEIQPLGGATSQVRMRTHQQQQQQTFRPKSMSTITRSSFYTRSVDDATTTTTKSSDYDVTDNWGDTNQKILLRSGSLNSINTTMKVVDIVTSQSRTTVKSTTSSFVPPLRSKSSPRYTTSPSTSRSSSSKSSPRSISSKSSSSTMTSSSSSSSRHSGVGGLTWAEVTRHDVATTDTSVASKSRRKKIAISRSVDNLTRMRERHLAKQASSESAPPSGGGSLMRQGSASSLKLETSLHRSGGLFSLTTNSSKLNDESLLSSADTSSLPHGSRSSSGHLGSRSSSSGIDLLTCPIEAGCETTIEISKGKSGLGVSIVGGRDSLLNSILVHTVYEEGAAAKDGRLWPGDRILWVNEHDIRNATHDEAIDILWKAAGRVRLVVIRDEHRCKRFIKWLRKYKVPFLKHWDTINNQTDEDIYNLHEVTLVKKKGLGLSIIGRRNHPGVYISDLIEGGVAQKEGTMKKGDHILKINGKDVKFASQETVASLLKNAREEVVIMVGRSKSGMMPDDIIQPSPSSSSLLLQQPDVVIPKEELALLSYTSKDREEHQIRFVEIHKEIPAQPLGVSIAGGMNSPLGDVPIFVAMIQQSGPAASQLNVGDIILSVNGRSTDGKTHDDVVQMLKGSDDMIVLMQVRDGGDEVHKLSEYLKDATSNVNEMISTWDPSIKDINQRSNNEAIDIELHRGNDGLGISIAGGYGSPHGNIPIFVKTVSKVGAAADEGRLKKGDQIISVNGEDLNGYTHEEAAEALRRKTNLIILRVIPS